MILDHAKPLDVEACKLNLGSTSFHSGNIYYLTTLFLLATRFICSSAVNIYRFVVATLFRQTTKYHELLPL